MHTAFKDFPFPLPLILDGATGTELIKAGMPAGICPEKWILDNPNVILNIQKRYAEAGSDVLLAPTFGANRIVLSRHGLADKTEEMNLALVKLSREAAGETLIAGDLSPTGKYLFPIGDMDADTMMDVYFEQASALEPYVDLFLCETNMDLAATRMAVQGIKKASKKPIFVTLTVTESGKTMSGDDPAAAFLTLSALGISAFGLNCSTGPREMKALLAPLVPLSYALGIPLIAKPNAGAPSADGSHNHLSPAEFADICAEMATIGIPILGGCCGTNAAHIRAIRDAVLRMQSSQSIKVLDASRLASTARVITEIPEPLPEPLFCDDDLAENAEEMAEEYGFAFVSLGTKEDADLLLEASAFLSAPLVLCGNEDATRHFSCYYCGKPLIL